MFSWLSAIPLVGKILDTATAWFTKAKDTELGKYTIDGTVNVEAMRQDTEIIRARVDLAKVMKDDPATKAGHWLIILPVGLWFTSIVYYSMFHTLIPDWTWVILALPHNLEYIPYAVIAYLFVTAWKR